MDSTFQTDDITAVGLLQEPVRRRLYDWVIAQDGPVGREAAAAAVGINRSLAAFHLDRLTEAGLLKAGYRRLTGRTGPGAGRPARVYERGEHAIALTLPARDYTRAADLFATALELTGAAGPPEVLQHVADEMGQHLGASASGATGRERLLGALRDSGYEPSVADDGTIRLRNCPFDALVDGHRPLVCGTNLALAKGLASGADASGYVPILDAEPGYCCVSFLKAAD